MIDRAGYTTVTPKKLKQLLEDSKVELHDAVEEIAKANPYVKPAEAADWVLLNGFQYLTPCEVRLGNDVKVFSRATTPELVEAALSGVVGDLDQCEITVAMAGEIYYHISILNGWLKMRRLPVPASWQAWEQTDYPELVSRSLIPPIPSSSEKLPGAVQMGKQELRKANTEARNEQWAQEAARLKRKHPKKSQKQIAGIIAKGPLGDGKSAETIRRAAFKK